MSQAGAQPQDPAATYKQRHADFGALHARLDRRARQNGNLNLGLFFGAFVALVVGSVRDEGAWYWLAGVLTAAFIVALLNFQNLRRKAARAATLAAINQEGLHRLVRNWEALPPPPTDLGLSKSSLSSSATAIDPPTAADLDLFALRALSHQPLHVLAKISDDPAGAWREGDRSVIARLADLELRDCGLAAPPAR